MDRDVPKPTLVEYTPMKIYFIEAGENGPIKIGKARNVKRRLDELQTGNHLELSIILTIPCESEKNADWMEKRLHRQFKKWRIRGEWFKRHILQEMKALERKA